MSERLPARLVLATGNAGKLRELRSILAPWRVEVFPLSEFSATAAEETGLTFVDNAILKARFAAGAALSLLAAAVVVRLAAAFVARFWRDEPPSLKSQEIQRRLCEPVLMKEALRRGLGWSMFGLALPWITLYFDGAFGAPVWWRQSAHWKGRRARRCR